MQIDNRSKQIYSKFCAIFLLAVFLFSCTDQGCIDADDFGEYQTQVIDVPSINATKNCNYDPARAIDDQSSDLDPCLTKNSVTVNNGTSYSSSTGCAGFSDMVIRNLCISQCTQTCVSQKTSDPSGQNDPHWVATDPRDDDSSYGVLINSGSEITIRALGTVNFGGNSTYPNLFAQATEPMPQSKSENWGSGKDIVFDVRSNQSLMTSFSGRWSDGTNSFTSGDPSSSLNSGTYNFAKRIFAFLIPHPSGYSFDSSTNTETGVPLLPNPSLWQCSYTGTDLKQADCKNNTSNTKINEAFPISDKDKLGTYGGLIRWAGDGIENESYDPFSGVTCTTSECSNTGAIKPLEGRMLANDLIISNPSTDESSYQVYFKSLHPNSSCNSLITLTTIGGIDEGNGAKDDGSQQTVEVVTSQWSTAFVDLEPNLKYAVLINKSECAKFIAIRFLKYKDIKINTSGYVSLKTIDGAETCKIEGRIINPTASRAKATGNTKGNFFEYGNFTDPTTTYGRDPFSELTVAPTFPVRRFDRAFVRKGQVIRLAPKSWNSNWVNGSIKRQCGIGMAMWIEPRPAVICKGKKTEIFNNPNCVLDYNNSGTLIGCKAVSTSCQDQSSSNYCKADNSNKQTLVIGGDKVVTCTAGIAPLFTKTNCNYVGDFTNPNNTSGCGGCRDATMASATTPARIEVGNIDQCYDLESYTGSVLNIPSSNESNINAFQAPENKLLRGAKILQPFNGSYGNFSDFTVSKSDIYQNNKVLQLSSPMTFSQDGRFQMFLIDGGDSFINLSSTYENNSPAGSNYNGRNGVMVSTSGTLTYNNGQWLQVVLCKEDKSNNNQCKSTDSEVLSKDLSSASNRGNNPAPAVVRVNQPVSANEQPKISSPYKFDAYGTLTRTTELTSADCTDVADGVQTFQDSTFYCFKKVSGEDENLIRLSFKILDPEIGNCATTDPVNSNPTDPLNGVRINNPFYDPSTTANATATCSSNSDLSKCTQKYYCGNKYQNNSGSYTVEVKVKNNSNNSISNIIGGVVTPLIELIDGPADKSRMGITERTYRLLISDPRYQAILKMCLVLMYTFYGFGFLIGVSNISPADLINRVIKIGLIYFFVSENGWYWFDRIAVQFFKNGTDYVAFMMASSFNDSPEVSNALASSSFYDKSILFSSVDRVFGMMFSNAVLNKTSALLFASIFGWAYVLLIYNSFMLYVYAVGNSVLHYLTAQIFMSILFTMGPIFFIFTLFPQTKDMFENWLKTIIGFALQQIFLLTTLSFFSMLMYEVIKMSLGFKVCWDVVWSINIITRIDLLSFWTIASMPPRTNAQSEVGNIGNPEGVPSIFTILYIWVIATLMNKFIGTMVDLAADISGGMKASSLGSGFKAIGSSAYNFAAGKGKAFLDKTGISGKVKDLKERADDYFFDSGAKADKRRKDLQDQSDKEIRERSKVVSSGDKAVKDYKKANALSLSKLNKDEQKKVLQNVKAEAMRDASKEMFAGKGDAAVEQYKKTNAEELSKMSDDEKAKKLEQVRNAAIDKEVDQMVSKKGLQYQGNNVFGAAKQAIWQKYKGSNLIKDVDKKVGTRFSKDEAKDAMKQMSAKDAMEFAEAIRDGKLKVGKSKAKNHVRSKGDAESDAIKELEDSGQIDKMSFGSGWTRSNADKAKIKRRAAEIYKAGKIDSAKNSNKDVSDLLEAATNKAIQEQIKQEKASGKDGKLVVGGKVQKDKVTEAEFKRNGRFKRGKSDDEMKAKKSSRKNLAKKIDEQIGEEQSRHDRAQETIDKSSQELAEINSDQGFRQKKESLKKLNQNLKKLNPLGSAAKAIQQQIAEIKSDEDFSQKSERSESLGQTIRQSETQKAISAKKLESLHGLKKKIPLEQDLPNRVGQEEKDLPNRVGDEESEAETKQEQDQPSEDGGSPDSPTASDNDGQQPENNSREGAAASAATDAVGMIAQMQMMGLGLGLGDAPAEGNTDAAAAATPPTEELRATSDNSSLPDDATELDGVNLEINDGSNAAEAEENKEERMEAEAQPTTPETPTNLDSNERELHETQTAEGGETPSRRQRVERIRAAAEAARGASLQEAAHQDHPSQSARADDSTPQAHRYDASSLPTREELNAGATEVQEEIETQEAAKTEIEEVQQEEYEPDFHPEEEEEVAQEYPDDFHPEVSDEEEYEDDFEQEENLQPTQEATSPTDLPSQAAVEEENEERPRKRPKLNDE